jgi:hypothetical protein
MRHGLGDLVRVPSRRTRLRRFAPITTRVINPLTRLFAGRLPWFGNLGHIGRTTGRRYRTPNFSSMPRMAPPPFGREMVGGVTGLRSCPEERSAEPEAPTKPPALARPGMGDIPLSHVEEPKPNEF